MFEQIKNFYYKTLFQIFGYSRQLPADDDVKLEIRRLLNASQDQADAAAPAQQTCCLYTFYEGGCACASNIHTPGDCDKWGDWWKNTQQRPGVAQLSAGTCPGSCKAYRL